MLNLLSFVICSYNDPTLLVGRGEGESEWGDWVLGDSLGFMSKRALWHHVEIMLHKLLRSLKKHRRDLYPVLYFDGDNKLNYRIYGQTIEGYHTKLRMSTEILNVEGYDFATKKTVT